MKLKVKDGTHVFDVQYKDGEVDEFTLDSGAGVNVWPQGRREDIPMMPKRSGFRMCAANGTEIQNLGRKIVQFRRVQAEAGHSHLAGVKRAWEFQAPEMQEERPATVFPQVLHEHTVRPNLVAAMDDAEITVDDDVDAGSRSPVKVAAPT